MVVIDLGQLNCTQLLCKRRSPFHNVCLECLNIIVYNEVETYKTLVLAFPTGLCRNKIYNLFSKSTGNWWNTPHLSLGSWRLRQDPNPFHLYENDLSGIGQRTEEQGRTLVLYSLHLEQRGKTEIHTPLKH